MQTPAVSVLLPAYNCSKFLSQAIESVLQQTFTHFEFIIINDGSTDDTEKVILSYSDPRIKYFKNDGNKGLIYTLNRGIDEAKGKYIARMDGDDICTPERFEKQVNWLEKNPHVSVLALTVTLIDEQNNVIGYWDDDKNNITTNSIKKFLSKNNCIAHPTVIFKTAIIKRFKFDTKQKLSEDYDLWLRLIANGNVIAKLDDVLFLHRILNDSFTRTRKYNVFTRISKVQIKFFINQLKDKQFNFFIVKVFCSGVINLFKGYGKAVKNILVKRDNKTR